MQSIQPAYHFREVLGDPGLEGVHRARNSHGLMFLICKMGLVAALTPVVDVLTNSVGYFTGKPSLSCKDCRDV